jgi:hypothetical protein
VEIAALITLEEPTKPMTQEAALAGFYERQTLTDKGLVSVRYPRLQILTIFACSAFLPRERGASPIWKRLLRYSSRGTTSVGFTKR